MRTDGRIATEPRRTFLRRAQALLLLPLVSVRPQVPGSSAPIVNDPVEPWLAGLNGKHRLFADVGSWKDDGPLRRVASFIEAYRESYGLRDADIRVLFGAHGTGIPYVLGDELWQRYRIGQRYGIADPVTGAPAERNILLGAAHEERPHSTAPGVLQLQMHGVRFLACQNTIRRLAGDLAAERRASAQDIEATLKAGLVSAAMVVPAMLLAANRAQESGFTYALLA